MYVNVLFAATAIIGALVYMTEVKPSTLPRIDARGAVLAALGLFSVVFGFSQAESHGWGSGVTTLPLAVGVVLLAVFVGVEQHVTQPLLPLRVLADSRSSILHSPQWKAVMRPASHFRLRTAGSRPPCNKPPELRVCGVHLMGWCSNPGRSFLRPLSRDGAPGVLKVPATSSTASRAAGAPPRRVGLRRERPAWSPSRSGRRGRSSVR